MATGDGLTLHAGSQTQEMTQEMTHAAEPRRQPGF